MASSQDKKMNERCDRWWFFLVVQPLLMAGCQEPHAPTSSRERFLWMGRWGASLAWGENGWVRNDRARTTLRVSRKCDQTQQQQGIQYFHLPYDDANKRRQPMTRLLTGWGETWSGRLNAQHDSPTSLARGTAIDWRNRRSNCAQLSHRNSGIHAVGEGGDEYCSLIGLN